jgi:uncharacterized integral membrane protein
MQNAIRLLWVAIFVGVLVLGWRFASVNAEPVAVSYVFGAFAPMPQWLALLIAFAVGASAAGLIASYQALKRGLVMRRYRKTVRGLESELHQLRNLPLADADAANLGAGERLESAPRSARARGG